MVHMLCAVVIFANVASSTPFVALADLDVLADIAVFADEVEALA